MVSLPALGKKLSPHYIDPPKIDGRDDLVVSQPPPVALPPIATGDGPAPAMPGTRHRTD